MSGPAVAPRDGASQEALNPDRERIRFLQSVAQERGSGLSLTEAWELLPPGSLLTAREIDEILGDGAGRDPMAAKRAEADRSPGPPILPGSDRVDGPWVMRVRDLWEKRLGYLRPLVRCLCITGSLAYNPIADPKDIDVFVATRNGALWLFLFLVFTHWRLSRRLRTTVREVPLCLNLVVDESEAPGLFRRLEGLLDSREALQAIPVFGGNYFRQLLRGAPGIAAQLPRLYTRRLTQLPPQTLGETSPEPSLARSLRLLNVLLFLPLAAYLQFTGLFRNHRYRREGRWSSIFSVRTAFHRMTFESESYRRLRLRYDRMGTPCSGLNLLRAGAFREGSPDR